MNRPSATKPRNGEADVDDGDLGEVLGFMRVLWAVAHGLEATSARMRAELGVTGPQRLILRLIGRYGTTAPKDLANTLHLHPSSLTGALRRLEKAGFIRRQRDPGDGRRAILSLTDKGRALNQRTQGTVESCVRNALRAVPPETVTVTRRMLRILASELGVRLT